MNGVISLQTVADKRLIVLEDATFVNQALLIRWDFAVLRDQLFEGPHRGIETRSHAKFGSVRAPDVDGHRGVSSSFATINGGSQRLTRISFSTHS